MRSTICLLGALTLLALSVTPRPGAAQYRPSPATDSGALGSGALIAPAPSPRMPVYARKRPEIALALGVLLPGAGHLYAGEIRRSNVIAGATAGLVLMGGLVWLTAFEPEMVCDYPLGSCESEDPRRTRRSDAIAIAFAAAGVAVWAYGAVDATQAARRANERHARRFGALRAVPIVAPAGHGSSRRVGLAFRAAW